MRHNFKPQKVRHEVLVQRFAAPLRDAAPSDLEEFWHRQHTYDRATVEDAAWVDMGPANFSGRATCLAGYLSRDPRNPDWPVVLYAGTAAGGLWKSDDGGGLWTSCWPHSLSQNIGAVAVDPDDTSRIICATGEGNFATASYPGSGIYESEDGGFTWRSFVWCPGKRRMSSEDRDRMPRRVSSISFSARRSSDQRRRIVFGSISNDPELAGGLYLDRPDGSISFLTSPFSDYPYNCYSTVFHPTDADTLFVTIEAGGTTNGIWRTKDGGETWERLHRGRNKRKGLPPGEICGRISLDISRSDPRVLFALVGSKPTVSRLAGNKGQTVLGIFKSEDGGDTWENTADEKFDFQKQLAFNNTIAIHPQKPGIAICGAVDLFLTDDGGRHWRGISSGERAAERSASRKNPHYVHTDQHAIFLPGNGHSAFVANDGGIFRIADATRTLSGEAWQEACQGMNTIMFYAIDVSQANHRIHGGGTQDNGTLLAGVNPGRGLRPPGDLRFTQVLQGDGGYLICDPDEPELAVASTFSTQTHFHLPGRRWANRLKTELWDDASPPVAPGEADVLGLTVMTIRPAANGAPRELFLGTNRLWRGQFRKPTRRSKKAKWVWRTSPHSFDGSAISAIEVSTADPSVMFIGTAFGGIFRSENAGRDWSEDLAGPPIPNYVITQIETHPRHPEIVVATVASSGRQTVSLHHDGRQYSHVFRSRDSGQSWEELDRWDEKAQRRQLPNVMYNGLAFETHSPFRIFVAGDAGPWVLEEDGRWLSIAGNMPSAVVSDIIYHHKTKSLWAGTYGRGMYRMKVPSREFTFHRGWPEDADSLLPPIEGYVLDPSVAGPEPLTPLPGAEFDNFPRHTRFSCSRVRGAVAYVFEAISREKIGKVVAFRRPGGSVEMSGATSYEWRCWALLPDFQCSMPSPARGFTYRV